MNFIRRLPLLLLVNLVTAPYLWADEGSPKWATAEQIRATVERSRSIPKSSGNAGGAQALSMILGIPADSPEITRAVANRGQPARQQNDLGEMKIVRHLQFNQGVAITPKEKIPPANILPFVESLRGQAQTDIRQKIFQAQRAAVERTLEPVNVPSCETAETIVTRRFESQSRVADKTILMDVLTMRQEAPLDSDEVLGKNVQILKFTENKSDPVSTMLGHAGVKCLPYRLRLVGNQRFLHYGLDALRNYDKNPLGKGELSDFMKKNARSYR